MNEHERYAWKLVNNARLSSILQSLSFRIDASTFALTFSEHDDMRRVNQPVPELFPSFFIRGNAQRKNRAAGSVVIINWFV